MSSVVHKINGLHGQRVQRAVLCRMMNYAKEQEQPRVMRMLAHVLEVNPKSKTFVVEVARPVIEVVPASFLACLEHHNDRSDKIEGLGKAVSPNDIYQMITNRMIDLIKAANTKDFVQPWSEKVSTDKPGYLIPFNFVSGKPYRGVNRFLLAGFGVLENPYFMTFKQVEAMGGKVKQGSTGFEVVYFTHLYRYQQAEPELEFATYDRGKFIGWLLSNKSKIAALDVLSPDELAAQSYLPILKYYKVFNGKDIEGIDFKLDKFKIGFVEPDKSAKDDNRLASAEGIIKHYPEKAPPLKHGGQRAFYNPTEDFVQMPKITDFDMVQDYYRTLFHEYIHSSGHQSRLARLFGKKYGSKEYAFEELIAELGATFLSAEAGIIWHTDKNAPAYLKSWNSALTQLENDNRFLMRAATQAQAAADYILNLDSNDEPAYYADLQKEIEPVKKKKSDFVLNDLADKYYKKVFEAATEQLQKDAAQSTDTVLSKAAGNMLDLIKGKFFELQYFKNGYGRNDDKPRYVNVPTVYKKLTIAEVRKIDDTEIVHFLLEKYKEYQYETAWEEYSFKGKNVHQIATIVKANIKLLQGFLAKAETEQLELQLQGKRGLNAPVLDFVVKRETALHGYDDMQEQPQAIQPEPAEIEVTEVEEVVCEPEAQVEPVEQVSPMSNNPKVRKIGASNDTPATYFRIGGETGKFLQRVERKPVHSVVITLDGEQGAGKTTTLYRWMNDFAEPGNKCLFISGEEHPDSVLAKDKVKKYLSPKAQQYIDTVAEVEHVPELYELISNYEIIFLDSWQKLQEMVGTIHLDKDLRKKIDGKVFVIIFQQTTQGRAKGGAGVVFDGDIITKMVKEDVFSDNYAYFNKNRYTLVPLETIRYNIAEGRCYNPEQEEAATVLEPATPLKKGNLTFNVR